MIAMIIYEITNTITGRSYIGMTAMPLAKRWWHHKNSARRGTKTALHNSMRLHGIEAFTIAQIATLLPGLGRKALGVLEQEIIAQRNSRLPHGYNMTQGGDGHLAGEGNILLGLKRTAEHRAKLSASWTPERKARHTELMQGRKGHKWSEHQKAAQKASWTEERRKKSAALVLANASACDNSARKVRIQKTMRALWANPEFRAGRIEHYRLLGRQVGQSNRRS